MHAFKEGWHAYFDGKDETYNHYGFGTGGWQDWTDGFSAAYEEDGRRSKAMRRVEGEVAGMRAEDQAKVNGFADKFRALIAEGGKQAVVALALVSAELNAE